MSLQGESMRRYLLDNKDLIKPKLCKHSRTNYGIAHNVLECAVLTCEDCACDFWE